MPKFRALKNELKARLEAPDLPDRSGSSGVPDRPDMQNWQNRRNWQDFLHELAGMDARETVGPLLALLPYGGKTAGRAASAIGAGVAALAGRDMELARVIMRRLMWSMNEESGNIGWGIPQAMAEILARSPALGREFHRVLLSYITDTGREDNYVDHAPLLRQCFWAVGRLAESAPLLALPALRALGQGLEHADSGVRGQAALALLKLANAVVKCEEATPGKALNEARELCAAHGADFFTGLMRNLAALENEQGELDYFDGSEMRSEPVAAIAAKTAKAITVLERFSN